MLQSPEGKQYAITAAHCVCKKSTNEPLPSDGFSVQGGNNNRFLGYVFEVKTIVVNEQYDGQYFHDIALLFLNGKFTINKNVQPIDLPDEGEDDLEKLWYVIVTGWGLIEEGNEEAQTQLQIVGLPTMDHETCVEEYIQWYWDKEVVHKNTICAGYDEGGKDACQVNLFF